MSISLIVSIGVGSALGLFAYSTWGDYCWNQFVEHRKLMRHRIRFYLRTGAITSEIAAELTDKVWAVDPSVHLHYIRTLRDPRVLYPSELSW